MAYDGWLEYNGEEFINLSRTAQLAEALGITSLWTDSGSVQWIQDDLAGTDYGDIAAAPWYDPGHAPSAEFVGLVVMSLPNLDDSTTTASTTESIGDGGHTSSGRNATLTLVWSVAILASTDRGADFGKRWMDRQLKNSGSPVFCRGADLRYFRYAGEDAPMVHRRDVRLTRGSSITRKRRDDCSVTWFVTFTTVCNDPYEYGEEFPQISELGGVVAGPSLLTSGDLPLVETTCPSFDYSPIYDPLFPAMVPSPTAPDFLPTGWTISAGDDFYRYWARIEPFEPTGLLSVPIITLTCDVESRMVRVSIWPATETNDVQCDPLFSAVVSYLPADQQFIIDGEQKAAYVWDGFSDSVRRTDTLVYAPDANPVQWTAFNDAGGFLVTLDMFDSEADGYEPVRAALTLVPKSD